MPATSKKKAAPIKRPAPSQTTLERLLQITETHGAVLDRVLAQLTEIRKAPPSIVVQGNTAPAETGNASARLGALLAIISGKGSQQLLEDMLSAGRPPSPEKLLQLADDHLARTGMKVAA